MMTELNAIFNRNAARFNLVARTKAETFNRILKLIEAVLNDPFRGIGKPEPLKYLGPGLWSRQITKEHLSRAPAA